RRPTARVASGREDGAVRRTSGRPSLSQSPRPERAWVSPKSAYSVSLPGTRSIGRRARTGRSSSSLEPASITGTRSPSRRRFARGWTRFGPRHVVVRGPNLSSWGRGSVLDRGERLEGVGLLPVDLGVAGPVVLVDDAADVGRASE